MEQKNCRSIKRISLNVLKTDYKVKIKLTSHVQQEWLALASQARKSISCWSEKGHLRLKGYYFSVSKEEKW